jgi:site-specific DNA recombinase
VIVYVIDRLTRAQGLTAYLLSEFERSGVELISVNDPLVKTREGGLIVGIKEYVAEVEREKIRERSLRGKRARVVGGKLHRSGTNLYGYRRNSEGTKREIYEPEAAVVREIFNAVAVEGLSARAVWRRLNESGVPPPSAGKRLYAGGYQNEIPAWGNTTIKRILHNPAYKGETILWQWQRDARTQMVKRRPDAERVTLPAGVTPALVSPETWEAAQRRLATNRSAHTRNQSRPYLLRGRIRCADCGRSMAPDIEHGNRIYRCTSRGRATARCNAKRVPADDTVDRSAFPRDARGRVLPLDPETKAALRTVPGVEASVWQRIEGILRDPQTVAQELKRLQDAGPNPSLVHDLENARSRLGGIDKQRQKFIELFAEADDGSEAWEMVKEQIDSIGAEKRTVSAIAAEIERQLGAQQAAVDQLRELAAHVERVGSNLKAFDFEEKRLALEALGVTVYADGRDWRIECGIPVGIDAAKPDTT